LKLQLGLDNATLPEDLNAWLAAASTHGNQAGFWSIT
jgi:hypothetical protein